VVEKLAGSNGGSWLSTNRLSMRVERVVGFGLGGVGSAQGSFTCGW